METSRSNKSAAKWKATQAHRAGLQSAEARSAEKSSVVSCNTLTNSKLTLEATSAQALFVESFMKWVSMAKQLHTSLRSPCAILSVGWSGVNLTAFGLWSSGNVFSGVMNHASPSGSPMDESGFGGCQENATCPNA